LSPHLQTLPRRPPLSALFSYLQVRTIQLCSDVHSGIRVSLRLTSSSPYLQGLLGPPLLSALQVPCRSEPLITHPKSWPFSHKKFLKTTAPNNQSASPPVMSGLDPHGTRNADKDGGPNGPQRHGLILVRWSETQMSKQSWMARVRIITRTRMEVQTGSEGTGSNL
jgi:hypothetical protein